jgi:hypothetical protein
VASSNTSTALSTIAGTSTVPSTLVSPAAPIKPVATKGTVAHSKPYLEAYSPFRALGK